jgi:F0F1-type ATP synthase membrane subunit c/vacuolar-type H+-ATPase subunit K
VAKIGVPAVVIVAVGAGALLLLSGRANEMLAERASTGTLSSGAPATLGVGIAPQGQPHGGVGTARTAVPAYPGEHGMVQVTAIWSANGTTLAAGDADGHPAVWRRALDGNWSMVSAAVLGGLTGHLTSVVQGPSGWIAVGSVAENRAAEPVVFASADGVTWKPLAALTALAGSNAQFLGVAAGPGGYLVVGRQGSGTRAYASLWWSADLRNWTGGGNSGYTGSFAAGAVAVGSGFVAVGSQGDLPAIWASTNGRQWTVYDIAKPPGAQTATLRYVAASPAGTFVAAGFGVNSAGAIPIVVASPDGGAHLTQVVLASPDGPATGTTGPAAGSGFVAVGLAGPANDQRAVAWTSADGLTWSAPIPVTSAGGSPITALTDKGSTVTGTAQQGADPSILTVPAP